MPYKIYIIKGVVIKNVRNSMPNLHSLEFLFMFDLFRSITSIDRIIMPNIANNLLSNSNNMLNIFVYHSNSNEETLSNIVKDSRFYPICSIF